MKNYILSWNDVKQRYLEFHRMDSFTENMAIDIDFGYWLVNNCIIPDVEVRTGLVEHEHAYRELIILTIDQGKTWLIITPTKEVVGYLHKKLPSIEPDSLDKTTLTDKDIFNNNNPKIYYRWL